MSITTKKHRTPEDFIKGAEEQRVAAVAEKNTDTGAVEKGIIEDIFQEKKEPLEMLGVDQNKEAYIRDKKFLLSIPFELHKIAVEKARERRISLHEFILKAMDKTIKEP